MFSEFIQVVERLQKLGLLSANPLPRPELTSIFGVDCTLPLIGRQELLDRALNQHFYTIGSDSDRTPLLIVNGGPGGGKSRLLVEIARLILKMYQDKSASCDVFGATFNNNHKPCTADKSVAIASPSALIGFRLLHIYAQTDRSDNSYGSWMETVLKHVSQDEIKLLTARHVLHYLRSLVSVSSGNVESLKPAVVFVDETLAPLNEEILGEIEIARMISSLCQIQGKTANLSCFFSSFAIGFLQRMHTFSGRNIRALPVGELPFADAVEIVFASVESEASRLLQRSGLSAMSASIRFSSKETVKMVVELIGTLPRALEILHNTLIQPGSSEKSVASIFEAVGQELSVRYYGTSRARVRLTADVIYCILFAKQVTLEHKFDCGLSVKQLLQGGYIRCPELDQIETTSMESGQLEISVAHLLALAFSESLSSSDLENCRIAVKNIFLIPLKRPFDMFEEVSRRVLLLRMLWLKRLGQTFTLQDLIPCLRWLSGSKSVRLIQLSLNAFEVDHEVCRFDGIPSPQELDQFVFGVRSATKRVSVWASISQFESGMDSLLFLPKLNSAGPSSSTRSKSRNQLRCRWLVVGLQNKFSSPNSDTYFTASEFQFSNMQFVAKLESVGWPLDSIVFVPLLCRRLLAQHFQDPAYRKSRASKPSIKAQGSELSQFFADTTVGVCDDWVALLSPTFANMIDHFITLARNDTSQKVFKSSTLPDAHVFHDRVLCMIQQAYQSVLSSRFRPSLDRLMHRHGRKV